MAKLHPTIKASAAKLSTTKTKVSAVISALLLVVLPLLGPALADLLATAKANPFRPYLREARDVLNSAQLDD